ncbi:peroxidase family 2 domain protein [Rhizoctonia solani 123E]|uniref:Peroxidase family 2 domain protein n=1 Tax=Rhizoctonia solani 123E TaxID=1423351 RepID=A0A074RRK7_9AGAM|nr:peroxidase family 2 domain protein [Rhizoctonia solani 123E]
MVLASLSKAIYDAGVSIGFLLYLLGWDLGLHIANVIRPRKQVGPALQADLSDVVALGGRMAAGENFDLPALVMLAHLAQRSTHWRIMASIIPRSGRGITWKELGEASQKAYNLAPTLCKQVPWLTAKFLFAGRDWNETMTLDDLNAHGAIEHDASYTRADIKWQHDQGVPDYEIIQGLYESAGLDIDNLKPKDKFTLEDLSNYLAYRRAHSKAFNGQYIMNKNGKTFGSINSAMAHIAFDGNAADLKTWLLEERIPDGWEPKNRSRHGVTIKQLNGIASQIEKGIARAGNLEARVLKNGAGKHMHRDKIEFDTDRH